MSAAEEELAAEVNRGCVCGGTRMRTMVVAAVNAGPPKSLDLSETAGGPTVLAGIRYGGAYNVQVPQVGDVVKFWVSAGGDPFVSDKIAV